MFPNLRRSTPSAIGRLSRAERRAPTAARRADSGHEPPIRDHEVLWGAPHKKCRSRLPRNRETANARALRAVIDRILTIAIACRIKQTGALHRLPPEPTTRALDTPESKAGLDKRSGSGEVMSGVGPARARRQLLSLPCAPPTNGPTRRQRLSGPTGSEVAIASEDRSPL